MVMQQGSPSLVKLGQEGTVDVAGGAPDYLVVRPGGAATFTSGTPFYFRLDRTEGVHKVHTESGAHAPTLEKFGPVTSLTLEFKRVPRVECLAYTLDENDPVIIIDPN